MKHFLKHTHHYLPLFGILFLAVTGFWLFSYDTYFQSFIVIAAAMAYVAWGLVHHYIHKELHPRIVIEYVAIGALGIAAVFSFLFLK
jgi:hypothetical protein